MKNWKISILFLALIGCSDQQSFSNLVNTKWLLPCGTEGSQQDQVDISKTSIVFTQFIFADAAGGGGTGCPTSDYSVAYTYDYTNGKSVLGSTFTDEYNEFKNLDVTLTSIVFTPLNATVTTDANAASFCGITNWAENVGQEVLTASGATYDNCGRNVGFQAGGGGGGGFNYRVSALDEARPFGVRLHNAAGDPAVLTSSLAIFTSYAGVVYNKTTQTLLLAPAIRSTQDGLSDATRALDVTASASYLLSPPVTK